MKTAYHNCDDTSVMGSVYTANIVLQRSFEEPTKKRTFFKSCKTDGSLTLYKRIQFKKNSLTVHMEIHDVHSTLAFRKER